MFVSQPVPSILQPDALCLFLLGIVYFVIDKRNMSHWESNMITKDHFSLTFV